MLNSKQYYRDKAPQGWKWVGAGDYPYTHIFCSGDYKKGFKEIECSEDCLTNGNLDCMIKYNVTMSKEALKEASKEIEARLKA